ncbi:MAG: VOC family protein [Pseudomonadota bacterium]
MKTLRSMPVIQVRDVDAAIRFYSRLGFESHGTWGEPSSFAITQRGQVTVALDRTQDGSVPVNQWWAAYIYVEDARALRDEYAAEGLSPSEMHYPEEYGCIDFDIVDPDGHRIAFGQALDPVPGPGLSDETGKG